jgi:hypothetical protein
MRKPVREGYWFGRKLFGFGFGPRTWQGWLTTLIWLVLMVLVPVVMPPEASHYFPVVAWVLLTLAFLAIFLVKLDVSR